MTTRINDEEFEGTGCFLGFMAGMLLAGAILFFLGNGIAQFNQRDIEPLSTLGHGDVTCSKQIWKWREAFAHLPEIAIVCEDWDDR